MMIWFHTNVCMCHDMVYYVAAETGRFIWKYVIVFFVDFLSVCLILTSLFSTYRLYWDRQKPANWTQCPTLTTEAMDLLPTLSYRHDNTWHCLYWPSWQHCLEQVSVTQTASEFSIWLKQTEQSLSFMLTLLGFYFHMHIFIAQTLLAVAKSPTKPIFSSNTEHETNR